MKGQIAALLRSSYDYFRIFFVGQPVLILGFVVLLVMSGRGQSYFKNLAEQWVLILPAITALLMFSVFHVENRYIAPFVVILWFGVLLAVRLPASQQSKKLLGCVCISMALLVLAPVVYDTIKKSYASVRHLRKGTEPAVVLHWRIANELRKKGMLPGDTVAIIGNGTRAYWAHLGQLKIVAEMRAEHIDEFLVTPQRVKDNIVDAFRRTRAEIIVGNLPAYCCGDGWESLNEPGYLVYILRKNEAHGLDWNKAPHKGL
jgi:hypothetical protein